MTPNEYQLAAMQTARQFDMRELRAAHAALSLTAEAGEVANLYAKFLRGKRLDPDEVLEEAGDVLWGVAAVLNDMGLSMNQAMERNIGKLRERHGERFNERYYQQ